jgi:hypothetical protein
MYVEFVTIDPLADGYATGTCLECGSAAVTAAVLVDGQIGYSCRAHVRQVDAAMLQAPVAAG